MCLIKYLWRPTNRVGRSLRARSLLCWNLLLSSNNWCSSNHSLRSRLLRLYVPVKSGEGRDDPVIQILQTIGVQSSHMANETQRMSVIIGREREKFKVLHSPPLCSNLWGGGSFVLDASLGFLFCVSLFRNASDFKKKSLERSCEL